MHTSVMITTHNRAADLKVTLLALRKLSPAPDELLVTLDNCTDESRSILASIWPEARLFETTARQGSIPSRDHMLRAATGDLVLSLDDDSYPLDHDFIPRATAMFEKDARLAVLWFPQRSEEFPESLTRTNFGTDSLTSSFASSGAVIRRGAYRSLPGYVTRFSHMFEEPDFALQCLSAGWRVIQHTGLIIRHHWSGVNRNEIRIHHLHARNECWSTLLRCPGPWWPLVALRRMVGQCIYAWKRGPKWLIQEPVWWWRALAGLRSVWRERKPVRWSDYQLWRRMLRTPKPVT